MRQMIEGTSSAEEHGVGLIAAWSASRLEYTPFRSGRLSGYLHKEFPGKDLCDVLAQLLLSPPGPAKALYRSSQNREVFVIKIVISGHEHEFFLKCIRFNRLRQLLFSVGLMPSAILRYVAVAKTLHAVGVTTPPVIAVAEEKSLVGTRRIFVVTEVSRNTVTLWECTGFASGGCRARDSLAERREIGRRLAELVRLLHTNGIFHLDLTPGNILVGRTQSGAVSLMLVDLDSAIVSRRPSGLLVGILKFIDLVKLNRQLYSITDRKERCRFLATYSGKALSRRRFRRVWFFLISSPFLLTLDKAQRRLHLVHLLKRVLVCLRIVR